MKISDSRLDGGLIGRLFTDHPKSVGETYLEHLGFAVAVARILLLAGAAALVHALVPALCQTTASRHIARLTSRVSPRQ
jgi:hypothetical protein